MILTSMQIWAIVIVLALCVLGVVLALIIKSRKKQTPFVPEDYSKYHVLHYGRDGVVYKVYFTRATTGPNKGAWTTYCIRIDANGNEYKSYFKSGQTDKFIAQLLLELNKIGKE